MVPHDRRRSAPRGQTLLLVGLVAAVMLAGCTSGSDGGSGDGGTSPSPTGGAGVGGNVTVGNGTGNASVSGSYSSTNTSTGAATPNSAAVSIEDGAFVDNTVAVRVGGTVTWTHNDGTTPHTVTADDGAFDSNPGCSATIPPLPPQGDCLTDGETFSWTFSSPGDFPYRCKVHTGMSGTVRVVA